LAIIIIIIIKIVLGVHTHKTLKNTEIWGKRLIKNNNKEMFRF